MFFVEICSRKIFFGFARTLWPQPLKIFTGNRCRYFEPFAFLPEFQYFQICHTPNKQEDPHGAPGNRSFAAFC